MGLAAGGTPDSTRPAIRDDVVQASSEDALFWGQRVFRGQGILCEISSAAAPCAAEEVARRPGNKGKMIVVTPASFGQQYLSTMLLEQTAQLKPRVKSLPDRGRPDHCGWPEGTLNAVSAESVRGARAARTAAGRLHRHRYPQLPEDHRNLVPLLLGPTNGPVDGGVGVP